MCKEAECALFGGESCGDGTVDVGEGCDDGNFRDGDGCSVRCTVEPGNVCQPGEPSVCEPDGVVICGDRVIEAPEACDDGDTDNGDGCSAFCAIESGFRCVGAPSLCAPICGDGLVRGGEPCDAGAAGDPGCSASCTVVAGLTCSGEPSRCTPVSTGPTCGDGVIEAPEACDDDDTDNGDGCSAVCTLEPGFTCDSEPSVCAPTCGDGRVIRSETCDDGPAADGDGCSSACAVEAGFTCQGEPSVCRTVYGDGFRTPDEACDDGNSDELDGCTSACTVGPVCGDSVITCGKEECDDGGRDDDDGCSARCTREGPVTATFVSDASATFQTCDAWDIGAPPRDGDTIVVAASAAATLELPALLVEQLVLESGTTATVMLPLQDDARSTGVIRAEVRGGTLRPPASSAGAVGDLVVGAGGRLVLPSGCLLVGIDDGPLPALSIAGSLTLEDGATFDSDEGVLVWSPIPQGFGVARLTSATPIVVADALIAPLGVETEDATEAVEMVLAAPLTITWTGIFFARPAAVDARLRAEGPGAVRSGDLLLLRKSLRPVGRAWWSSRPCSSR